MNEERLSLMLSTTDDDQSKSCTSSLTTTHHHFSSRNQKLRIIAAVARCHEIKLKVVKKRRSKIYRSSDNRKISSNMASTETSCLSSSSSGISSARSQHKITATKAEKMQATTKQIRRRCSVGSTHMRRRAEAILKLLSGGCFSEVNIRRVLGDSPDTSKALRMLLKQEEVKRSGRGGPKDPYIYTVINFETYFLTKKKKVFLFDSD
ncbi:hypothetical protein REPUB_Repub06bG0120100 [Reevesia pubescens]